MILDNDKGLLLMRNDQLGERSWRSDECYKLIFSPFGKGYYQTNHGDISIDKDEFLILNPNEVHKQIRSIKEKFLVEIQPSMLQDASEQMGIVTSPEFSLISYKHPQIQQWVTFVRNFLSLNEAAGSVVNQFFLDNSLTQLSIMMMQYGAGSHQVEFPVIKSKDNINDVINAFKESYREDWTLDEMAKVARLNKYQFAHLFREELGLSPYSWLQLYRLLRTQHSLLHSNDPIISIAFNNGFKSVSSYNQLFKKIYRKTPTEFRRIHGFDK
ncbi:helix-turn-helix transcriptional regulator [Guptibacillus spartinae]|uniref:helix-turn-helix transcriptional regulator n=1 Tax=Guptibacillus spartinae TaxID=3025679 RepID=UPI002360DD3C|nr:AraC family transcriptional regulator [Pseudalkalibacillus spartinae]